MLFGGMQTMKCHLRHIANRMRTAGRDRLTEAGVTLIEILIVLAMVTLLASLVIGMATQVDNQSRAKSLENTFAVLETALEEYREQTGGFPGQPELASGNAADHCEILYGELDSIAGSRKMLEQIDAPAIQDRTGNGVPEIYDPWGTILDYVYVLLTDTYPRLISAGPDKNFDTPDDITSKRK
jgi:type II secretory pathway pseudopilin PulG